MALATLWTYHTPLGCGLLWPCSHLQLPESPQNLLLALLLALPLQQLLVPLWWRPL